MGRGQRWVRASTQIRGTDRDGLPALHPSGVSGGDARIQTLSPNRVGSQRCDFSGVDGT